MDIRDQIVNKMVEEGISTKEIINSVISDEFQQANKATRTNNEVEISGLGKFIFNTRKAEKILPLLKGAQERMTEFKKWITNDYINYIESKCQN